MCVYLESIHTTEDYRTSSILDFDIDLFVVWASLLAIGNIVLNTVACCGIGSEGVIICLLHWLSILLQALFLVVLVMM